MNKRNDSEGLLKKLQSLHLRLKRDFIPIGYKEMVHLSKLDTSQISCLVKGGILSYVKNISPGAGNRARKYKWVGIIPNIHMAEELLKQTSKTETIQDAVKEEAPVIRTEPTPETRASKLVELQEHTALVSFADTDDFVEIRISKKVQPSLAMMLVSEYMKEIE